MLHAVGFPQPQTIPERCGRYWHQQSNVDISLLLEPKDEEEPQQTASPRSLARSDSVHSAVAPVQPLPPNAPISGGRPLAQPSSTVPSKRAARANELPTSESPAKKQSKWSADEDSKIIQLRGEGMKWEDISKHLPGRSAISCRLHYQNYLERRSEWDEDRKNKLARLYERFKADMWAKIAEEMAIPWRAAEAMHWQLGEQEMARRAGVITPFILATSNSNPIGGAVHQRSGLRHNTTSMVATRHEQRPQAGNNQLPSLAELTAGLPAYATPSSVYPGSDRTPGTPYQYSISRQTLTPSPGNHPHHHQRIEPRPPPLSSHPPTTDYFPQRP